jgi:hypothetical protein
MVVWSDSRSGGLRIYAGRVTPQGSLLDGNGFLVGPAVLNRQYLPSIAFNGTRFFVVWGYATGPFAVTGRFINTDGSLGDTVKVADASTMVYNTHLAYSGTNFLVVWIEYVTNASLLRGQLLTPDGSHIGNPFTIASGVYHIHSLGLRFDGFNYIVTYSINNTGTYQIWGKKYDTSGNPLGTEFRISQSNYNCYYGDIIPGVDNYYLNVWSENRNSQYDVYGNLDIEILRVEEKIEEGVSKVSLKSTLVSNTIQLNGAEGVEVSVFDISGRKIGTTYSGVFDCQGFCEGIYFVKTSTGAQFKVVKVR